MTRKKQKLNDEDEEKDEEEKKLELLLFGTHHQDNDNDDDDEEDQDGGRPMANLLDQDLFFIDDGQSTQPQQSKKHAWTDTSESSTTNKISLLSGPSRLRKLRLSLQEDSITEKEYESRLRAQFERINPEPSWAKRARKKNREERNEGEEGEEEEKIGNLFTSTSGILKAAEKRKKSVVLQSGTLSIERLRDANLSTQNTSPGHVQALTFHPNYKIPILCVGTADRRIRLYNVDGHTSPLIQTLHIPSLPLTSPTSVLFHPSGSSLLLSGPRPFFFTHDLQSGLTTRHDRGLWGTSFSLSSSTTTLERPQKRSRTSDSGGGTAESIHMSSFSPQGDLLAVSAGKSSQIHLVDWKSGAGQVIHSFKCAGGGSVSGLWWFNHQYLNVLTSDAEVYLWDVGERRCVSRWKDEGGYRGAGRVLDGTNAGSNGGYLGIGSSSGYANIYSSSVFSPSSETQSNPKPIKSIGNLTTPISTLKFNHDAQLLAIGSKDKKDSMRLIHLPTLTSFANWPTSSTPLGYVTAVDFSPKSEYVVVGNKKGRVLLYHLRDYGVS